MEVADARSSSNDLSSAPNSDIEGPVVAHPAHTLLSTDAYSSRFAADGSTRPVPDVGVANGQARGPGAAAPATMQADRQDLAIVKQRKPRKKKDPNEDLSTATAEKKPRKPREPRATSGLTAYARKKLKLENDENSSSSQCTPSTADLQSSKLVQPLTFHHEPQQSAEQNRDEAAKYSQNGFLMHDNQMKSQTPQISEPLYSQQSTPQPQVATPRSSAAYDPVRSLLSSQTTQTPPRPAFRPSASPAISSIIDPPVPLQSAAVPYTQNRHNRDESDASRHVNTTSNRLAPTSLDLDVPPPDQAALRKPSITKKPSSEAPTRGTSPKPTRAKEQPPPLPSGSGLLSSSLFGGDSGMDANKSTSEKGPNIVLHVDLKDPNNKVINFARMAEEKYGFAALYPRQAAQRERLAKVAAAGAALERTTSGRGTSAGESGDDDASVDIDRDSDNDGDVAMTGVNGGGDIGNSGTDGPGPKKRRRRKVEEYDQDDPFVDDTELMWEAQAAASKDGFFVYCGPLVPEGEKPTVERADGTVKRGRGRGRGGGPGSRGGRGGAAAEGSGRGGGPGSRGGGITRKPRITKAERLLREQEKAAREKMAPIAAKPSAYPP